MYWLYLFKNGEFNKESLKFFFNINNEFFLRNFFYDFNFGFI